MTRIYYTHDNGGKPFVVVINDDIHQAKIYKREWNDRIDDYKKPKLIKTIRYVRKFIGDSPKSWNMYREKGNSILFQLKNNRFLFVGLDVKEFSLMKGDKPVKYISIIGNSDVIYPYLIGKQYTYFLASSDIGFIDNQYLDLTTDVYDQYYELIKEYGRTPSLGSLDIQVVHPRLL